MSQTLTQETVNLIEKSELDYMLDRMKAIQERPGWKFFLAMKSDIPAAVGVMYMNDSVASLTFAGTLPEYRNQGLQQALIRRRIYEATITNCSIVIGQAGFLTQSHRNMENIGMKIGYVRTTWTEL